MSMFEPFSFFINHPLKYPEQEKAVKVTCECCKKTFTENAILRHIGQSKDCKNHYGARFDEQKRKDNRERVKKHREKSGAKKETCEYCNKKFSEKSLLRHIGQRKACKKHYGVRFNEQRRKDTKERVQRHREKNRTKQVSCEYCKKKLSETTILRHIGQSEACKNHYGPRFDEQKRNKNRERVEKYRQQKGTRKELDQQKKAYVFNPELQEKKKKRYEKEKEELEIWRKGEAFKRRMKDAQEILQRNEKKAREINSRGSEWLKHSFEKVFKEFKTWNSKVQEKISTFERCIQEKFLEIESQIDEKVMKVKRYLAGPLPYDFPIFNPVFDNFGFDQSRGLPIKSQNKISLIWHDLKQTIDLGLDNISEKMGMPKANIPWHSVLCPICEIYRNILTGEKYLPPRFSSEQNPDMILGC